MAYICQGSIFKVDSSLTKVKWKPQCGSAGLSDKCTCYYSLIRSVHGEFSHGSFYSQELTAHHNTQLNCPHNNSALYNKPLQARGGGQL